MKEAEVEAGGIPAVEGEWVAVQRVVVATRHDNTSCSFNFC